MLSLKAFLYRFRFCETVCQPCLWQQVQNSAVLVKRVWLSVFCYNAKILFENNRKANCVKRVGYYKFAVILKCQKVGRGYCVVFLFAFVEHFGWCRQNNILIFKLSVALYAKMFLSSSPKSMTARIFRSVFLLCRRLCAIRLQKAKMSGRIQSIHFCRWFFNIFAAVRLAQGYCLKIL